MPKGYLFSLNQKRNHAKLRAVESIIIAGTAGISFFCQKVVRKGTRSPGITTLPREYHSSITDGNNQAKSREKAAMKGSPSFTHATSFPDRFIRQTMSLPNVIALMKPNESIVDIIVARRPAKKSPLITGGSTDNPKAGNARAASDPSGKTKRL